MPPSGASPLPWRMLATILAFPLLLVSVCLRVSPSLPRGRRVGADPPSRAVMWSVFHTEPGFCLVANLPVFGDTIPACVE